MEQTAIKRMLKEWVTLDNEIKELGKKIRQVRLDKKQTSVELMNIMKTNNIDCFDINDEKIIYKKRNSKKAITSKSLSMLLQSYFEGDSTQIENLTNYVEHNRPEKMIESIVRKQNPLTP